VLQLPAAINATVDGGSTGVVRILDDDPPTLPGKRR
jgi:hypothetical protein